MPRVSKVKTVSSSKLAVNIAKFALDKKAENVVSLNVKNLTNITDEFVICSSDTNIQVKAIADSIRKNTDYKPVRICLLYTSPSPRDATLSRMPSSA